MFRSVTPYKAGSVIPNSAEIPAENAVDFRTLSLLFNAIARHAPDSAMLCASEAGK
ncbi:hypothetical protein D3C74_501780 [compost metagenome]